MLALLESLKNYISAYVIGLQDAQPIFAGQDEITISTTCAYSDLETIIVYDPTHSQETYIRDIAPKTDNLLWLSEPITVDLPAPQIQKVIEGRFLSGGIHFGNPIIKEFPAITLTDSSRDEVCTVGALFTRTHHIRINIWVDAADYMLQYQLADTYAEKIRDALSLRMNIDPCNFPAIFNSNVDDIEVTDQPGGRQTCVSIPYMVQESVQKMTRQLPTLLQFPQR